MQFYQQIQLKKLQDAVQNALFIIKNIFVVVIKKAF